jgi:hypothetical protein
MGSKRKDKFVIHAVDINTIPLHAVLDLIQDSIARQSKDDLSILAGGLIYDKETNTKWHRFEFKVIKDLNSIPMADNGHEDLVVKLGRALLRNTYTIKDDHEQIDLIFSNAKVVPEKYMMVTLFGESIGQSKDDNVLCIAALLGVWNEKGLYITHMSVSDQVFFQG